MKILEIFEPLVIVSLGAGKQGPETNEVLVFQNITAYNYITERLI